MPEMFANVDAVPYRWPFNGQWNADDTALLLLGFQNTLVEALDAEAEVAVAARLAEAARKKNIPVVASRRGQVAGVPAVLQRQMLPGLITPERETEGWQLSAQFAPPGEISVVDHAGDNAFYETGLELSLRERGIRNLLICGLPTEGLVHATQRNANDMGFECLAIADACKGTSPDRHASQLRITTFGNGLFGAVATSDSVFRSLSRT
ncbi:isochorismatase family cysteine hydrolase [Rhizobium sp. L1K21]|uniref:isochorismatase family cysteine hydrolase n=1 Tax=Rhizobium sp. L1K21 TaxID=2954933 RepID=UPI0020922576|nr:isochorismatase family cysteine hydrolase [Rhizobium sp. L1K21]MCO6188642.1 cysteine hydrolase [Rhizobium sp. L1K21]